MALTKKTVVEPEGINFGDLESGLYVSGGGLPEGDYIWTDLTVQMHEGFGTVKQTPRLGVMITMVPLESPESESRQQFYSLGSSADKNFAPDPNTGKGMVAIPGASGITLNNQTNWAYLLKSLKDSGLPPGTFTNDVSVLEGIWVHMQNIPEPKERAGFVNRTAEVEQVRRENTIAVVSEIKDDGKPWEGTGGIPDAAPAKKGPVKVASKPVAKTATKPAVEEEAVEEAAEETEGTDEEVQIAAMGALATVLEKNKKGMAKVTLKTSAGKEVKNTYDQAMLTKVVDTYWTTDDALNSLLGEIGFQVVGAMVKPVVA
jgi:hypothetical protein